MLIRVEIGLIGRIWYVDLREILATSNLSGDTSAVVSQNCLHALKVTPS